MRRLAGLLAVTLVAASAAGAASAEVRQGPAGTRFYSPPTPLPVSGTVAIPKGRAPKGGWPVISWAHATVGLADVCAPTRSDVLGGYERPLLNRWLRAGYAVVRTDYQGLGTPGGNPDLIGTSEAHTVLDIVRAAHAFDRELDLHRVGLAGHSVGGHA